MRWILCAMMLFVLSRAFAQDSSALINEQLDKQYALNIAEKTPLPQVLSRITKDTGVRIDVAPQVWELLPWGEQTTLAAKIENQTLRGAISALARPLGLTFQLKEEAIELQPLPALARLGRRATVDELGVLDLMSRALLNGNGGAMTIHALLAAVDARLEAEKSSFAIENRAFNGNADQAQVSVPRNATLLEAMETIPQSTDATWYPWGKTIVVRPKVDQVRDLLNKTITVRFNDTDISQVLAELQTRANVRFTIEPGAVQRIPQDSRIVKLVLDNVSIQQALDSIAGFTGLAWSATDKGVYIWNPASGTGVQNREPSVGLVTLDNGMQVVVRESQVPPDLREYVKHKMQQYWEKTRQQMKEEGFVPPATQPAGATTKPSRPDDL